MVQMDPDVTDQAWSGARIGALISDHPQTAAAPGRGTIELRGVTKRYGEETVVSGIAASIAPGRVLLAARPIGLGQNDHPDDGRRLRAPDAGAILLDGADIAAVPPQKRGFGMVFQNYAIFPHLNVFENIAFPLRARRWAKEAIAERVTWALELVRLGRFAERHARQLSGGQQQRVALARAIVFHPPSY